MRGPESASRKQRTREVTWTSYQAFLFFRNKSTPDVGPIRLRQVGEVGEALASQRESFVISDVNEGLDATVATP